MIREVDRVHFLSAPGLARQERLKKIKIELEVLIDANTLLMRLLHGEHKISKTDLRLRIDIRKGLSSNWVQLKSMIKFLYRHGHKIENKGM